MICTMDVAAAAISTPWSICMTLIDQVFGTTGHLSPWQECARAPVVFAYGLLLVRLAGRRAFARWSALDIVVAIIVGSSLSRTQTGNAPLFGTILATAIVMVLHWVLARASALSPWVSALVEGPAVSLGRGGTLDRSAIVTHNVSQADVAEALRQAGAEDVCQSRLLILEPSGRIAVLR